MRGREVIWDTVERWRRKQEVAHDVRVSHSAKLQALIARWLEQLPGVDVFGAHLGGGPLGSPIVGGRMDYDGRELLEFERDRLFPDLLDHLQSLRLKVNPATSWQEFRKKSGSLFSACRRLWERCERSVARSFGITRRRKGARDTAWESLIALAYEQAVAAAAIAAGDIYRMSSWTDTPPTASIQSDDFVYRMGGVGLVQRKPRPGEDLDHFREEMSQRMTTLRGIVQGAEFVAHATLVYRQTLYLQRVRENLRHALEEAASYEILPLTCELIRTEI